MTDPHQARITGAMKFFMDEGWSRNQAAGIVANLEAESMVSPTQAQYGGGPGYGLAQWEGPRQRDFRAWSGHDIHESTFTEQLQFIQHELEGTQKAAGRALIATHTARDAAATVCRLYERPVNTEGQAKHRADLAEAILKTDFSNVQAGVSHAE